MPKLGIPHGPQHPPINALQQPQPIRVYHWLCNYCHPWLAVANQGTPELHSPTQLALQLLPTRAPQLCKEYQPGCPTTTAIHGAHQLCSYCQLGHRSSALTDPTGSVPTNQCALALQLLPARAPQPCNHRQTGCPDCNHSSTPTNPQGSAPNNQGTVRGELGSSLTTELAILYLRVRQNFAQSFLKCKVSTCHPSSLYSPIDPTSLIPSIQLGFPILHPPLCDD